VVVLSGDVVPRERDGRGLRSGIALGPIRNVCYHCENKHGVVWEKVVVSKNGDAAEQFTRVFGDSDRYSSSNWRCSQQPASSHYS
jgi:hypothetical protein